MAKLNKRDLILESIIEAYLCENIAIGSAELSARMSEPIPASTIRVYFKKLADEGEIVKLHVSGGRMPTPIAVRRYWQERDHIFKSAQIDLSQNSLSHLGFLAKDYGFYCLLFGSPKQNLKAVSEISGASGGKFLLLEFSADEIVIKFDERVQKFLANLIGVSLDQLEEFSAQVGLSELRVKIRELKRSKIYFSENEAEALNSFGVQVFRALAQPSFASSLSLGLNFLPIFSDDSVALRLNASYEGESATLLCAGSVYADYLKFINEIKEVA